MDSRLRGNDVNLMAANMGGWYVWGIAALIMAVLPAEEILNISYVAKAYLQNRHSLFFKVCGRVERHLFKAAQAQYDRVTVLSHSFGVVVATEVLGRYTQIPNLRIVTLGGPLYLISAHSPRVEQALLEVLKNDSIQSWRDFYSDQDWLCTYSLPQPHSDHYQSELITSTVPLDQKLKGASHHLYFTDWAVMEAILN